MVSLVREAHCAIKGHRTQPLPLYYLTTTTVCGSRTFSFCPKRHGGRKEMILFCLFFFFLRPCFGDALPFMCPLCILLHEIHALLWFVPILQSWSPCPFNTDETVCTAQQTSESLWKADPVQLQPGHCLAVNSHFPELTLSVSASVIIIFCYFIQCVFPNALFFSKAIFPSGLPTEMIMLPYIFFPVTGHLNNP